MCPKGEGLTVDEVGQPQTHNSWAPLSGLGVVEFGGDVAVRYCGRLFSLLGAKVVRVSSANLTPTTSLTPEFIAWLDAGKSLTTDLSDALHAVSEARSHNVLIAGQTHDVVELASTTLIAHGEATSLLGLTWFDSIGPYRDWRGNDAILQALTGVAFGFGERSGPPTLPQGFAPQILGGLVGFIATLASLFASRSRGARIDVNVLEAALCFADIGAVVLAGTDIKVERLGVNRFAPLCPCNIYPTSDGEIGVTVLTPAQWAALAALVGRPDLASHSGYQTTLERHAHFDEIDGLLAQAFLEHPSAHWINQGEKLRIPITPAPRPGALPDLDHWVERGAFVPIGDGPAAPKGPSLPFHFQFGGARSSMPRGGPRGPLEGIRVADFSMGWAGPLAARFLADLGADVVKIESRERPDWWRGWENSADADPPSTEIQKNFLAVNRNKRGIDLDLSEPHGRAIAERIIRVSDVVIENQGPGVMDKLGVGPSVQRRLNPGVIAMSMPAFGRTGPLAGVRAYGSTVEQASGMPFINGSAEWPPCLQHVAYGDAVAGLYGAAAALIGLYSRARLGGAEIDLCQVECLFQLDADAIIAEQVSGIPLPRMGSRRENFAPCCVAQASGTDSWLAVAVNSDAEWQGLCDAMNRRDLESDAELANHSGRKRREAELEDAIRMWARSRDAREAAYQLQAHGVPAVPVIAVHDLIDDPQLIASSFWTRQARRHVGEHFTPEAPFRIDGQRPIIYRPAPVLGEHTDEIVAEMKAWGVSSQGSPRIDPA